MFDQASRLLIQTDLANNDRVQPPCQDRDSGLGTPTPDMFATVRHWTHLPQSATPHFRPPILFSGATSTGGRCSVSWLAGEISVHVATVLLAQQAKTACLSGGRCDPIALLTIAAVVPTPISTSGDHAFCPAEIWQIRVWRS